MKNSTLPLNTTMLAALLFFGAHVLAVADEAPLEKASSEADTATEGASAEQIQTLIRDLNSDAFATRQTASRKLAGLGKAVIPAVEKAATGPELEVTTRAMALLEKFATSGSSPAKTEAQAALKRIASTEHETAAARAAKILADVVQKSQGRHGQIIPGRGIRIVGGQGGIFRIQVQAIGGPGNQKIQIRNVNGVKTIDAEKNGKKVHIVDDPNNGIQMKVTEKKGGKEVTNHYKAKNAADLKKNNPEAYKIYDEFSRGVAGPAIIRRIQMRQGGIQIAPEPQPAGKAEAKPEKEADAEKQPEEGGEDK